MPYKHRSLTLLTVTTASVLGLSSQAFATPVAVTFDCQAKTLIGNKTVEQKLNLNVDAPATVAPNTEFDIVAAPDPFEVPANVAGFDLKKIDNFALKIPIPAHSTYVGATLTGGSGFEGTPTVALNADKTIATVTLPGALKAGSEVTLPKVDAHLRSGDSGTITATLYGTSYADPGLTFTSTAGTIIGDQTSPVSCYPKPNPTLSTTTIS